MHYYKLNSLLQKSFINIRVYIHDYYFKDLRSTYIRLF